MTEFNTIPELRAAVKKARYVYVRIRFGVNDSWVNITKREALHFLKDIPDHYTVDDIEMYGESFGYTKGGDVYMG